MYFNVFVFDTIAKDLDTITLMVQASGVTATLVTLIAGTLSDKIGNRNKFISIGYIIWGVTVALFGMLHLEINSIFIAAILTIIGYSINDTIVTFDIIRENYQTKYKNNFTKRKAKTCCLSARHVLN